MSPGDPAVIIAQHKGGTVEPADPFYIPRPIMRGNLHGCPGPPRGSAPIGKPSSGTSKLEGRRGGTGYTGHFYIERGISAHLYSVHTRVFTLYSASFSDPSTTSMPTPQPFKNTVCAHSNKVAVCEFVG